MSTNTEKDPEELLQLARAGSSAAKGQLLERYRSYLTLLARVQVGRRLQGKADAADLVQEAFLEVHCTFAHLRSTTMHMEKYAVCTYTANPQGGSSWSYCL